MKFEKYFNQAKVKGVSRLTNSNVKKLTPKGEKIVEHTQSKALELQEYLKNNELLTDEVESDLNYLLREINQTHYSMIANKELRLSFKKVEIDNGRGVIGGFSFFFGMFTNAAAISSHDPAAIFAASVLNLITVSSLVPWLLSEKSFKFRSATPEKKAPQI